MNYLYASAGVKTALTNGIQYPVDFSFMNFGTDPLLSNYILSNDVRDVDYSHGKAISIDESSLIETQGIGFGPVDWNKNGNTSDIISLKRHSGIPTGNTILKDYDDWTNLRYIFHENNIFMLTRHIDMPVICKPD